MTERPSHPLPSTLPTLEEAIRLKRLERPTREFWQEFDRGLREKQLAALLEPQPRLGNWWRGLSVRTLKWCVPLGAAAAAAFLVVVRPIVPVENGDVQVAASKGAPAAGPIAGKSSAHTLSQTGRAVPAELALAADRPESGAVQSLADDLSGAKLTITSLTDALEGIDNQPLERELTPLEIAQTLPWIGSSMAGHRRSHWLLTESELDVLDSDGAAGWSFAETKPSSALFGDLAAFQRQFTRLIAADLRITAAYAHNLPLVRTTGTVAAADPGRRADVDYDYRGGVSRVDVRGSSLSIRF